MTNELIIHKTERTTFFQRVYPVPCELHKYLISAVFAIKDRNILV